MQNKQISLLAFTIVVVNSIVAQGPYFKLNAGYSMKMGSQTILSSYSYTHGLRPYSGYETYAVQNVSFGKGFNFGGTFGYMFNKYIGAEMDVSYLLGSEITTSYTDVLMPSVWGPGASYTGPPFIIQSQDVMYARMLSVIPSVVIAAGYEKINPYAKFGLVIGSGSVFYEYTSTTISNGVVIGSSKIKLSGGVALGFSSAIGAVINLSKKLSVFSELKMVSLSYAPTQGKVTENTTYGQDNLPYMLTSEKEYEFVENNYVAGNMNSHDGSVPTKEMRTKLPFSSLGLNCGIMFSF